MQLSSHDAVAGAVPRISTRPTRHAFNAYIQMKEPNPISSSSEHFNAMRLIKIKSPKEKKEKNGDETGAADLFRHPPPPLCVRYKPPTLVPSYRQHIYNEHVCYVWPEARPTNQVEEIQ